MMKKMSMICLLLFILANVFSTGAYAVSNAPMFKVENKIFVTPKGEPAPYVNKDNRTMGSLRLVSKALGVEDSNITWDNKTQTATLSQDGNTVEVVVGKKELRLNGEIVVMDTVAEMKQGRVFIPARFIGESLGWYVGYDAIGKAVLFSQNPINELPTNNIEEMLGLNVVKQLPVTTNVNGLVFTLHEMWIYDYDSEEAKALNDKFEFSAWGTINTVRKQLKADAKAYVVQSKVTIKNESNVAIKFDPDNREDYYMFMTGIGVTRRPTQTDNSELYWKTNNAEMINTLNIAPGESLTGYYYTIMNDYKPIEFIALTIDNKEHTSELIYLTERK